MWWQTLAPGSTASSAQPDLHVSSPSAGVKGQSEGQPLCIVDKRLFTADHVTQATHTHTHAKAHLGETRVCLHFSFMLFVSAGVWDETFWPLLSVTIIVITGESSGWAREATSWLDSLMMSSVIGSPSPCNAVSFQEKNKGWTFLPAVPQVTTSEAEYPLYVNEKFLLPWPCCEILESQWVVNQRFGVTQWSEAGLRMSKSFLFTHLITWCLGIDRRYISFKLLIYLRWRTSKYNLASISTEGSPSTNQLKWS